MNPKELHSPQFIRLESGFLKWLQTLNYSDATIATRKRNIREFLLYLERCNINTIGQNTDDKAKRFVRYLKRRENKLFGSGLMNASINVGISTANRFFEYLRQTGTATVPDNLEHVEGYYKPGNILTLQEISLLYETTCQHNPNVKPKNRPLEEAVQTRDRAMLGIYYGCGLRKSEGAGLKANDILIERKLIYVRKGKGSRERHVPVTGNNLKYITEYLKSGRKILLERSVEDTIQENFFINRYGEACSDQALSARLGKLVKNSGNSILQGKKPTLHTLRHSIATHLLQQGMEIEMIQKFLGHASLESTQIYTHIINEL